MSILVILLFTLPPLLSGTTCNVVIDELLAFVQNKISVIDNDTLFQILKSSFVT